MPLHRAVVNLTLSPNVCLLNDLTVRLCCNSQEALECWNITTESFGLNFLLDVGGVVASEHRTDLVDVFREKQRIDFGCVP